MSAPFGATSYTYERRGLLREELTFDGMFTQRYGYDADGNRTSIRYPSGDMVSYTVGGIHRRSTERCRQERKGSSLSIAESNTRWLFSPAGPWRR